MRLIKAFVILALVVSLLPGCATMSDSTRTKAEGTGIGAVLGAGVGYLVGGGKGAAIGAAAGAGVGFLVGNEIAKRKQSYASTEDFLNAEITNTQEYNRTAVAHNQKLSQDIAALEKESKNLRSQYDKGKTDKKTLTAKRDQLQKRINDSKKLEDTLAKELEVQTAILQDERKTRPANDQYITRLEKEVAALQKNLNQLHNNNTQMASINQRLSV
ncbi:MAG: hypothetical protein GX043_02025 [Desulfovibrionales bacterium]|nr:hypothetical protein [Desulfovibrionales bacterium]